VTAKTVEAAAKPASDPEMADAPAKNANAIGLKSQVYDMAEIRPGRSDDWRWTGAPAK
jgi:hypothetical protein